MAGLALTSVCDPVVSSTSDPEGSYGSAMIYVLLTYGGWSEAAYLSAEVQDGERNMVRVLVGSIGAIALVFLLVNFAYLKGLGLSAIANSDAVTADLMYQVLGEVGAQFISLLVAVSALGGNAGDDDNWGAYQLCSGTRLEAVELARALARTDTDTAQCFISSEYYYFSFDSIGNSRTQWFCDNG